MKLQQLRYACEIARRELNGSAAAEALHPPQPGISKQLRNLEQELGIEIFVRNGKRLVGVTEPGRAVIVIAERMLADAANLKRAGEDFAGEKLGTLTIAATRPGSPRRWPGAKPPCASRPSISRSTPGWWRSPATGGTAASWCRPS